MPGTDDVTGKAMADALGVKYVSDDDQKDQNPDTKQDQDQDKDQDDKKQDQDQGGADDKNDDTKQDDDTKKDDDASSGDQKDGDDDKGSDQADDKKTIPKSDASDSDSDQSANFETTLAERSGGRFNSIADIDKALEDAPANAFANEQIAKLNDYVKSGGSLNDFVRTQTVDYATMSPEELIYSKMAMDDPEMSAEEISLLMEDDYGVADDATDRTKQVAGAKLKRASREALKELQEHQKKWSVPLADQKIDREANVKQWEAQLNGAVDNTNEIDIALNQTDNFTFKLEDDAKAKLKTNYRELDKFFSRYIDASGKEDTARFVRDMAILENFESIVRSAASASKSQGKKDVVDDIKSPNFEGKDKKGGDDTTPTVAQQAMAEFYKHNR